MYVEVKRLIFHGNEHRSFARSLARSQCTTPPTEPGSSTAFTLVDGFASRLVSTEGSGVYGEGIAYSDMKHLILTMLDETGTQERHELGAKLPSKSQLALMAFEKERDLDGASNETRASSPPPPPPPH
ncbi:unnamed protein product [Angiostrongylus costaricensis]|uniref:Uncharacterized protein n=1 Tax=Angiostrongylus costaricensis TaxID=334426 RepID=A0A0R3PL31_ANGCS|nr:unnamed protein product [Angiostrongylus costaricensis]